MNKPHVHKDAIIAWANGASIQYRYGDNAWRDNIVEPTWDYLAQYRAKPEREWPVTSLSPCQLRMAFDVGVDSSDEAIVKTANAAIKQYIIDSENK